jgi:hypothetical protein
MTTLGDVRTRIRKDLHDLDSAAYRWADSQLDRHIGRALDELSLAIPLEKTALIATTNGSRDLSLATLTGLIEVEAVEFPTGSFPPAYVESSRWADTITLDVDTPPTGANAKLYYTARHTLDTSGTTLPGHLEDLVAMGASAYAALEQGAYTIDRLNTGEQVSQEFEAWGRARLTAFAQLLHQYGRKNRVRGRRLFTPA